MKTALAALLILILRVAPVWAVLGEYESSVSLDEQALHGTGRQEARPGYRLRQISASNGSVIREFISPEGLVFGVAWQSPRMPNLTQLLGSNITELQVTLQSRTPGPPSRAPLIVQTPRLVFVSGGHLRSFHGYAYVPGLVPAGVSPGVVQ
jgi:hypothetical protein